MRFTILPLLLAAIVLALCACDTGGIPPGADCAAHSDCRLVATCCDCLALPPGEEPPDCEIPECIVDECMGWFGTSNVIAVCNEEAVCEVQPGE